MERILVVNVNWLGDVIFSAPVFKALRDSYPNAYISCLAVPRVKGVLECIPSIDEVIVYDEKGRHWSPFEKLKLIFRLRRERFDVAFLLHRSLTRALLVFLAGIPKRVGYDEKKRGRYLTDIVKSNSEAVHRSDHYLNVIESYGVTVSDRRCSLIVTNEAEREVALLLRANGIHEEDDFVVVNAGGNWGLKRWPKNNFTKLIEQLMRDDKTKVVLSGAVGDQSLIDDIVTPLKDKPVILAGTTNLQQLMALMKRAQVVISADSGPLHLANGVGSEVIGLFGPTRPEITGPRGSGKAHIIQHDVGCNREACYYLECPENICMQAVTINNVLEIIQQIRN